jgi:exopolysaccharide biosynthesis polyprenyl glycosylphosphotransferase
MSAVTTEERVEATPVARTSRRRITGTKALLRRSLVVATDGLAIAGGLALASVVAGPVAAGVWLSVLFGAMLWGWMAVSGLYNSRLVTDRREEFARLGRSAVRSLLMLAAVSYVFGLSVDLRGGLWLLLATSATVGTGREALRMWFARGRRAGHGLWASILVATEADGARFRSGIDANRTSPHTILDHIDPDDHRDINELLTRVVARARAHDARGVVVLESSLDGDTANTLVRGLLDARLYVDLASSLSDISVDRLATRNLGPSLATWIAPRPKGGWRGRAKRAFDLSIAVSALTVLSPVLAVLALVVRFTSPGPVFFRQERVGRNGEPFDVLKFRSMVVNAEELLDELEAENEGAGPLFKMKADPRVTGIGRFLRKTSLDELPQLINVVRNEMSIVGPRPALRSEMAQWDPALYARLQVKPGITGMWQVSGRSGTSFEEYTRLDLYYVHNWSLVVDLSIIARTIPAVVRSEGAY